MLFNYAVLFGNYLDDNKEVINKRSPAYRQPISVKYRWQIGYAWRSLFFFTLPLAIISSLAPICSATAQIVEDNSLDTTGRTSVTRDIEIRGIVSDRIDDGTTRGSNLFHSFAEFNVGENRGVYFSNPAGIENILTRVTGGNPSNIRGTLGVLGNANLFFINPNGIVFGPNSRLDLGGSFFGSTASSVVFDNGFEFSTTNPQAPLLSVNIPVGLRFRDNPGDITTNRSVVGDSVFSSFLQVQPGKSLALVGGNVSLDGAILFAPGGRIEIGGLSTAGTVGINPDGSLSFPDGVARGDVLFNNEAIASVVASDGGDIAINARKLNILVGSGLYAGIRQNSGSTSSQGGNITLNASETTVANSFIYNFVNFGAVGNSGNINIDTGRLTLTDSAEIATYTLGQGNAGNVTVNAFDSVEVIGGSILGSLVLRGAIGQGGDLTINTKRLSIRDASILATSTLGNGNAGNLLIRASDLVEVLGTGEPDVDPSLRASVETGATGNGGDLTIETKNLVIRNAQVGTSVFGKGNAGNLTVRATESVEIIGKVFRSNPDPEKPPIRNPAGLFSQVNRQGEGNGGNITVETPRLSVGDGGKIQVAVFGKGNAGNILIRASDIDIYDTPGKADFFQGGIFAGFQVDEDETTAPPKGDFGGTVTIETDRLRVRDGGTITVFTEGDGNAGTLRITAKDYIEVSGEVFGKTTNRRFTSSISARATADSTGNGGTLILDTDKLIVRDQGQITVSSENNKPAGNLEIKARTIKLDNRGGITATARGGDGGNITLNIRDYLFMRRNSEISTSAGTAETGGGNGGNIFINSPNGFLIAPPNENSDITANAFTGQGGKVTINSAGIFGFVPRSRQDLERLRPNDLDPRQIPTNDITAVSQQNPSLSGTVTLNTPEVDPSRGLVELPETVVDPQDQIAQNPCQRGGSSEFIITGRGGLPPNPNEMLSNDNVRVDWVEPVGSRGNSQSIKINHSSTQLSAKKIVPAQGWVFNQKGDVVLTAYNPTATNLPQRTSSKTTAACPAPF
ncbi:S-layer family protein [Chlorogloeopsis sp. ULAP01]|uniref:beta strand repeat-containing protein n=1 Tax=Chlorogloeopsis sp. ULAP01 TaxID=3056483 RepID=UPI0025AB06CC|nr:S-layer family protein [Chlorogloeopsis sp. ULAP01]MDM9381136.1 S-layer family protein [Chlorogloeopsis sp. ULAP01]